MTCLSVDATWNLEFSDRFVLKRLDSLEPQVGRPTHFAGMAFYQRTPGQADAGGRDGIANADGLTKHRKHPGVA